MQNEGSNALTIVSVPPGGEGRASQSATECRARSFSAGEVPAGQVPAAADLPAVRARRLSPRQLRAAQMLASGMAVFEIARELKVDRGTIYRWRRSRNRAFLDEVQRHSEQLAGELEAVARRLLVKSTLCLDRLMNDDGCPANWAARVLRNRYLWRLAMPELTEERSASRGV